MGWISNIFSSSGVNVISSVGNVLDDLITTDEELALSDIQKKKITAAYNIKMQEMMLQLDKQAADQELNLETELTSRLKMDMKSDSWLSKNIRPMTLIFMTLIVTVLSFATIFTVGFTEDQVATVKEWIPFFQNIMLTIYGFYFGSRGLEKWQKIRSSATAQAQTNNSANFLETQEPRG